VIAHRFGESAPFSVGVEEELMLVDAETLLLSPRVQELVAAADGAMLKTELLAAVVESTTGVCETPAEALAELRAGRAVAAATAESLGLRIMAAGSHPISLPEEQTVVSEERYLEFVEYAGVSARFQGVNGLHVHVGVPDPEACYRALEGVLPWLPLLLALSVNSPYFAGRETGLLSNRAPVLAQLPRAGAPPPFGSYAAWEAWIGRLGRLGVVADDTRIWWDVRPAPRFGTIEIRMPDQPTSVELSGAFAAIVQALCREAVEGDDLRIADRGDYVHNRWAAMRFGPAAELIHPDGDRVALASEAGAELLERLGLDGAFDPARCEAELQLDAGLEGACADLVERSLVS
jgi:glutamate---cysteine ligase / carboxylate-amine ligase